MAMDWLTEFLAGVPGMGGMGGMGGWAGADNTATGMGVPILPSTTPGVGGEAAPAGLDGSTAGADAPTGGFNSNNFMAGLRGVQAPKAPDVVKPGTAAPPVQRPIQSGEFLALLNALSAPRVAPQRPTTLGGALGTGRY